MINGLAEFDALPDSAENGNPSEDASLNTQQMKAKHSVVQANNLSSKYI